MTGVRTRKVFCGSHDGNTTLTVLEDDACDEDKKYESEEECAGEEECTGGTWHIGPLGPCSAECDGGKQTRKVFCIAGSGEPVAPDECPEDMRPMEEVDCNQQECEEMKEDEDEGGDEDEGEDEDEGGDEDEEEEKAPGPDIPTSIPTKDPGSRPIS